VTGWAAVTVTLADYAAKARDIGADIGQSLVSAFRSAEDAVAAFMKTGKLDFRYLVTSLIADLARLAPGTVTWRCFPVAEGCSGDLRLTLNKENGRGCVFP